jgi:hypothetical protein
MTTTTSRRAGNQALSYWDGSDNDEPDEPEPDEDEAPDG